jgi:outer membrane protein assembly factor BamA
MNEEIRWTFPWKTWKRWQIVQFYDWTRVVDSESIYKERECESFGFGIRYRWQFLTFRLDYAFKKDLSNWDPEPFGWGRFAFDLSQTF